VAHPGLVAIAKEIFDREMPQPNQIARKRQDVHVSASDLLVVPEGTITEAGLRQNLNVGIGYIEAWLRGIGCVPLYNLMEDAATAEISRARSGSGSGMAPGSTTDAPSTRPCAGRSWTKNSGSCAPSLATAPAMRMPPIYSAS